MGKKKENKLFHVGKGFKNDNFVTPFKGSPLTYMDSYKKDNGAFHSRRKFDKYGNACVDIDAASDKHSFDHKHYIVDNKRDLNGRELSKKERKEIYKAKKKRRFWRND